MQRPGTYAGARGMNLAEPEYVIVGRILAPSGLQGKLKVEVITDFPERFTPDAQVYLNQQPVTIEQVEWYKGRLVIKLNAIDSVEEARKLRGQYLEIPASQLQPLPAAQYYLFQVIGLEVKTTQGELLGKVTEIITADSNDTYVVNGDWGEILIPAIEDVIKSIDLERGEMTIEPIEGLLELNETRSSRGKGAKSKPKSTS